MTEAGISLAAVGVEDPEDRPPPRRAGPIAGHDHLRSLADDVASEPNPRPPSQLHPDSGRLADRTAQARGQTRWLEDREADPGSAGEGCQPAEPVGDAAPLRGPGVEALREVDDQEVDRPAREEGAADREALVDVDRGHDDEPFRPDPPRDRFDRVERGREVQPGDDRAPGLGFRGEAEDERRSAARQIAPQRDAHPPRQATRAEDRVEGAEAGREDSRRIWLADRRSVDPGIALGGLERHGGEGPDDLADATNGLTESRRSGRAPPRPEGRQGRRHVGGECRHG
ncbi:MAG TPA: hypothetical protein VJ506_03675 [Candidatus Limnocylindrales bacterium]|nr:hypothetical protein [Candidatus Limnocylindrales bacterium]